MTCSPVPDALDSRDWAYSSDSTQIGSKSPMQCPPTMPLADSAAECTRPDCLRLVAQIDVVHESAAGHVVHDSH